MDSQLSKNVPTIFRSFLERISSSDVVWSKIAKIAILACFDENHVTTVEFDSIETFTKIGNRIRFQIILSHNDRIIYIFEK